MVNEKLKNIGNASITKRKKYFSKLLGAYY